jgi:hypothetical protein
MGCSVRSRLALLGVIGPVFAATSWAGEEGERVHFEYRVPAGCPGEAEFLDLVAGDGGRLIRAGDAEQVRTFVVRIEGTSSFEGRVAVRAADGTEAEKVTLGDRCEDVVRSAAVLVSLSLEPGPPDAPAPAPASVASTTPPPALPPPPAPVERAPVPRRAAVERALAVREETVDDWRPRWRVGFSVDGTLSAGASPGMNPGLAAYVEVVHVGPGYFEPSFRLGGEMGSPWRVQEQWAPEPEPYLCCGAGTTKLLKRVLRLDACPLQSLSAPSWSADAFTAQLCARFEGGSMEAEEAQQVENAVDVHRLWLAAGALLRVRWVFPTFFFEWEAGAIFPLERTRFIVEPGNTVFEVPVAAGTTGLGIGVLFL